MALRRRYEGGWPRTRSRRKPSIRDVCNVGIGAQPEACATGGQRQMLRPWGQRGRKVTAKADWGANGTEGPFLALMAGARLKHSFSELDLEPANCLD